MIKIEEDKNGTAHYFAANPEQNNENGEISDIIWFKYTNHSVFTPEEEREVFARMGGHRISYTKALFGIGVAARHILDYAQDKLASAEPELHLGSGFFFPKKVVRDRSKLPKMDRLIAENIEISNSGKRAYKKMEKVHGRNTARLRSLIAPWGPRIALLDESFIGKEVSENLENKVNDAKASRNEYYNVREKIFYNNIRYIISVGGEYSSSFMGSTYLGFKDFLSFAAEGLLIAIDRFDPSKKVRLATYASWWMNQKIRRAIVDSRPGVRLPVHLIDNIRKVSHAIREICQGKESEQVPSVDEIVSISGLDPKIIEKCLRHNHYAFSLDIPTGESQEPFYECIKDENAHMADRAVGEEDLKSRIGELLSGLNPRERDILTKRFGIGDGERQTLEEIGSQYKMTRERIRQIEAKALRKLRNPGRLRIAGLTTDEIPA